MCGSGADGGGGGERQRATKEVVAAACDGGVRRQAACGCHVKTENEILRGEIKMYVKDNMSGHKFAERANLCFYDRHTYNRVKNRVKKT